MTRTTTARTARHHWEKEIEARHWCHHMRERWSGDKVLTFHRFAGAVKDPLVTGIIFGGFAALIVFLGFYDEYRRHKLTERKLWEKASRRSNFGFPCLSAVLSFGRQPYSIWGLVKTRPCAELTSVASPVDKSSETSQGVRKPDLHSGKLTETLLFLVAQ
ncbi:hypothetical protein MJC1_04081 [Methylocystis sp. MJC1]|nr:hypothetical protein MJC1_04081 [Methylocystis sp. MJC1]